MSQAVQGLLPRLTFEAESHRYWLDGEEVPHVTGVLESERLLDFGGTSPSELQYARDRGTAVHLATVLDDVDDLLIASVDPVIAPFLNAWRRFRVEARFICTSSEQMAYHETYRYACTYDRLGHFLRGPHSGTALAEGVRAIVEIKTGQPQRATGYQLAAQLACLPRIEQNRKRFGCYLRADGTYSLVEYTAREDLSIFLAALTLFNCRRRSA